MKRNKQISRKYKNNGVKRPAAGWFIVFTVIIALIAAFIWLGIKAGEKADTSKQSAVAISEVKV